MNIMKVLSRWFSFTKYDTNQITFNLLNGDYQLHQANERIEMLIHDYDSTGSLALMYAKTIFEQYLSEKKISLFEMLSNPESTSEYRAAWDAFQSEEVTVLENTYLDALNSLIRKISKSEFIGERNRDNERKTVFAAIDRVVESISKLKLDVYKRGDAIGEIKKFSTTISVFPTLAQCVLALETAADGIYLCYISMGDSADGYFGYFIKSNGTVCSLNERPDEAYPGQHGRSRNGRWSECKAYDIFPYDVMFSFDGYDYKGYSSVHKIDESKLDFFAFGADVYFPIVLAMLMLSQKYAGKSVDDPIVYIDSLFTANLSRALECAADKSLVPVSTSAIASVNKKFSIPFTQADVVCGAYNKRFNCADNRDKPYFETGTFPEQDENSYSQLLIDLYGEGFELKTSELLTSDSCMRMLPTRCADLECEPAYGEKDDCEHNTDGICNGQSSSNYNVEFVGTKGRMEMEAYRQARKQLADHIKKRMLEDYKTCGGADNVLDWWQKELESRRQEIINRFIGLYLENKVAEMPAPEKHNKWNQVIGKEWTDNDCVELQNGDGFKFYCYPDTKNRTIYGNWEFIKLSEQGAKYTQYGRTVRTGFDVCEVTGSKCSIYFTFIPRDWKDMEQFVGMEVPEILKGWKKNTAPTGNPLLEATDAVASIETPLKILNFRRNGAEDYEKLGLNKRHITFGFSIGFSKSGLKKLVKEYCEAN